MASYYVNKKAQSNGDHEVHTSDCTFFPEIVNALYLGEFSSCYDAVREAKKIYSQADGCMYCCPACHKS